MLLLLCSRDKNILEKLIIITIQIRDVSYAITKIQLNVLNFRVLDIFVHFCKKFREILLRSFKSC